MELLLVKLVMFYVLHWAGAVAIAVLLSILLLTVGALWLLAIAAAG